MLSLLVISAQSPTKYFSAEQSHNHWHSIHTFHFKARIISPLLILSDGFPKPPHLPPIRIYPDCNLSTQTSHNSLGLDPSGLAQVSGSCNLEFGVDVGGVASTMGISDFGCSTRVTLTIFGDCIRGSTILVSWSCSFEYLVFRLKYSSSILFASPSNCLILCVCSSNCCLKVLFSVWSFAFNDSTLSSWRILFFCCTRSSLSWEIWEWRFAIVFSYSAFWKVKSSLR